LTLTNKQLQKNRIQDLRGDLKQVIKIEIALEKRYGVGYFFRNVRILNPNYIMNDKTRV